MIEKFDMFQEIFGKWYKYGCWYMDRIQTNAGMQFTSREFQ